MIPIGVFAGRDVAVFGLTDASVAAARALKSGGAQVHAWDDSDSARQKAQAAGVPLSDINARDWNGIAALLVAETIEVGPGAHRVVALARAVGVPVLTEIELFAEAVAALAPSARPRLVGVAGGDDRLAALLGHILKSGGKDGRVAGIDAPGVLALPPLHAGAIYVLPLSPRQMTLAEQMRFDVAILADGADPRLFAKQGAGDWAIIAVDSAEAAQLYTRLITEGGRSVAPVSARQALSKGVSALGAQIYDALDGPAQSVADISRAAALPGSVNRLRAATAYAAARALGLAPRAIAAALVSYPGLPHRLETAGRLDRVLFVNDSASDEPAKTAKALAQYARVRWIAGGVARAGGLEALSAQLNHVAKAYLIGEAAASFAATLKRAGIPAQVCADLDDAVLQAGADAEGDSEPVVLLSPACAPFDQFADIAARGDAFKKAFRALESTGLTAPAAVRTAS